MRATDLHCVFAGRPADHLHHVAGRGVDGVYLDPTFVVPLVRRQHVVEHIGWRVVGVGEDVDLDPNVLRLRRSGLFLVRLGEYHADGVVMLPATLVRELGRMLNRLAADLGGAER